MVLELLTIHGKKKYRYRFNLIKDYVGDKAILKDGLICYFYDYSKFEKMLSDIVIEKQTKINKYGLQNYQKYMQIEATNELYKRFKKMEGVN